MKSWHIYTILGAVIVLLLILLLLTLYDPGFRNKSESYDETVLKEQIADRERKIEALTIFISKTREKFKADSLEGVKKDSTYKSNLKTQSREIARMKQNPIVIKVREEVREIDSLIVLQDSLIQTSVSRVSELEGQLFVLQKDMSQVYIDCEARFRVQQEKDSIQSAVIENQSKQMRKERRKNRLSKIAAIGAGVIGFVLGSQL